MKKRIFYYLYRASVFFLMTFAFVNVSCQYDYRSPLPGVIELRLRTISNQIAFSDSNNFLLKLSTILAIRSDGGIQVVYEDVKAIQTTTKVVNTLDIHARDSSLVIGAAYAPPGYYNSIVMVIQPAAEVILRDYQKISVERPEGLSTLLQFHKNYRIEESRTTRIVLTINLDKSLRKSAFTYLFVPDYDITSIQTY